VQLNSFLVAAADALPEPARVGLPDVPLRHEATLAAMLERPQPLTRELMESGEIVTDAHSSATWDIALSQIAYRRAIVETVPKAFLVN
jgi:hypothetical protein